MNQKKSKHKIPLLPLIAVLVILLAIVAVVAMELTGTDVPNVTEPTQTTTVPVETVVNTPAVIQPAEDAQDLGEDLKLHSFGSYAGMYMEDGTDEVLSNIAMAILTNEGEQDLQYAQITVTYADEVCAYTVTNLPAGASVVLLEQERKALPAGDPVSTQMENVVFFQTPMDAQSGIFEISGMDGVMNVKNISGTDIAGDIYVYYKYSAADLYYGGITFRIRIQGGLGAGQIHQSITSHFDPSRCTIVDIVCVGA